MGGLASSIGSTAGGIVGGIYNGLGMGNNFQATPTATPQQVQAAYDQNQAALQQQQNFVNALQTQGSQGLATQTQLSGMLNQEAQGQGANPAQAMLANATGANVANQAALMAGQRGAGANTGMIARQAAQQGAMAQQNAAGQGAQLQAQQQLAAQNQLQGLAGTQIGQQAGAQQQYVGNVQSEQAGLMNAINQQNQINSGVAAQNQQAKNHLIGGLTGAGGAAMAAMYSGGVVKNMADGGGVTTPAIPQGFESTAGSTGAPQSSVAKFLSGMSGSAPGAPQDPVVSGFTQLGGGLGHLLKAKPTQAPPGAAAPAGPPKMAGGPKDSGSDMGVSPQQNFMQMEPASVAPAMELAAKGGQVGTHKKVPVMLSPGERYLSPDKAEAVASKKADPIKDSKKVPGKAKVKGDSLKNDTYPTTLEEGGIVIPRSVLESKDAAKKAAEFVTAHLARSGHLPRKS